MDGLFCARGACGLCLAIVGLTLFLWQVHRDEVAKAMKIASPGYKRGQLLDLAISVACLATLLPGACILSPMIHRLPGITAGGY